MEWGRYKNVCILEVFVELTVLAFFVVCDDIFVTLIPYQFMVSKYSLFWHHAILAHYLLFQKLPQP